MNAEVEIFDELTSLEQATPEAAWAFAKFALLRSLVERAKAEGVWSGVMSGPMTADSLFDLLREMAMSQERMIEEHADGSFSIQPLDSLIADARAFAMSKFPDKSLIAAEFDRLSRLIK